MENKTLSDKKQDYPMGDTWYYLHEDVKEAVKKLTKEVETLEDMPTRLAIILTINEIFGKKLT